MCAPRSSRGAPLPLAARAAGADRVGGGASVFQARQCRGRRHGRSVHVRRSGDDRHRCAVWVAGRIRHDVMPVEWLVCWRHGWVRADRQLDQPEQHFRERLVAVSDSPDHWEGLQLLDRRRQLCRAGRGPVLSGDRDGCDGLDGWRERCVPAIDESGWRRLGVAGSAVCPFAAARRAGAGVCRRRLHDDVRRR